MTLLDRISLPVDGSAEMFLEARREGYKFLDRLQTEWDSGVNRFDQPGEILCGCFRDGVLIAIGGVNRNPFGNDFRIGRIRRVYVRPAWRKQGVGELLINFLLTKARQEFDAVVLRTDNPNAARLYERMGFVPVSEANATHMLSFLT